VTDIWAGFDGAAAAIPPTPVKTLAWPSWAGALQTTGATGNNPMASAKADPWAGFSDVTPPTAQENYDAALGNVRKNEFPTMSDASFADYAKHELAPYSPTDLAQNQQMLGFGDEIGAGIGALGNQVRQWTGGGGPGFGPAYDDLSKLETARLALGRERGGALGAAAEFIGGMSSMSPARAGVEAAVAAGRPVSAAVTGQIARPVWQQAVTTGATAAPIGAVSGFGNADGDLGQRAKGALGGAVAAGFLGGVTPYVAETVGGAYGNIAAALAQRKAAAAVGIEPQAAAALADIMHADGSLGASGTANMAAAGPEAMLADAGRGARQTLDTAIQGSGEAGREATDAIDERVARDSGRINDAINTHLGQPQGLNEMRQNIAQASAPARADAYDAAYASPIDYSSPAGRSLEDMLSNRVRPSTIAHANQLMRDRGDVSHQIMATEADDGSVTYRTMPDVRQIDYITRALNSQVEKSATHGHLGGNTTEGSGLQDLAQNLRGTLRGHVPAYDTALKTAADPIQRSQALKFGYGAVNPSTTVDDVAQALHDNPHPQASRAMAQGIRSALEDKLANVTRTMSGGDQQAREAIATIKGMTTRAARQKLTMIIGEAPANALLDQLDQSAHSFELRASVADGSQTYARLASKEALDKFSEGSDPLRTLAGGHPLEAAKETVAALTGETKAAAKERADRFQQQIASVLLRQGGHGVQAMQALRQLNRRSASSYAIADALRGSMTALGNAARVGFRPRQLTDQERAN
jgi:hypothetical protein